VQQEFQYFVGIDWGSENHRVCLMRADGELVEQRWIEHNGSSLAEMADWLWGQAGQLAACVAVAIEVPRGAIVETLLERGFAVFSINPKQLDRFRDRYFPSGAKDDSRDAFVLADSLRTDRHCFGAVQLDVPEMIRLRELSRLEDELIQEQTRLQNRLREQLHRYFPQLLQLCSSVDEPWLWSLLQTAPTPALAASLSQSKIKSLLQRYRIRRLQPEQVQMVLRSKPLILAPGAEQAGKEHALLLLPRLQLLHQQRKDLAQRIQSILEELSATPEEQTEHRDAAILLSLPGLGRKIAATMLSEASQAIADRDYHALRCYSGAAPITQQSGKRKLVLMRRSVNERLRTALYHWTRVSVICDSASKKTYAQLRAKGHSHGRALRGMADRWLKVLISMLRNNALYDPQRHAA
jgi:transposase